MDTFSVIEMAKNLRQARIHIENCGELLEQCNIADDPVGMAKAAQKARTEAFQCLCRAMDDLPGLGEEHPFPEHLG